MGKGVGRASEGLLAGGGVRLLGEQALANGVTILYSFGVTFLIIKAIDILVGLRVSEETESQGLDVNEHAETAYNFAERAMGRSH